jgi:hypothetical protein
VLNLFPQLFRLSSGDVRRPTVMVKSVPYDPRKQAAGVFTLAALTEIILSAQERMQDKPSHWKVSVQTDIMWTGGAVLLETDLPDQEEEGLKIMITACHRAAALLGFTPPEKIA